MRGPCWTEHNVFLLYSLYSTNLLNKVIQQILAEAVVKEVGVQNSTQQPPLTVELHQLLYIFLREE